MAEMPAGFIDMLADAESGPYSDVWDKIDVPQVGVVTVRRPRPNAIPLLAMAVNGEPEKDPDAERIRQERAGEFAAKLIQQHLADGEWERLNDAMMDGDAHPDTIQLVRDAIVTWGTARPFKAVARLSLQTAYEWRRLRERWWSVGVDPMGLPHMHLVLDMMERLMVESMVGEDGEERFAKFLDDMYSLPAPPRAVRTGKRKRRMMTPPPGFSPDEVADSWKQWTNAQGAAR